MTAKEKLEVIVRALDMKRGENIQVLEIAWEGDGSEHEIQINW